MNIAMRELADMTAVRLGVYPDRRLSSGPYNCTLEEICSRIVVPMAIRLTESADLYSLECVRDMRDTLRVSADYGNEGYVECVLPADFLRLRLVRMYGWPHGVERVTEADDGTAAGLAVGLGDGAPGWMRTQRLRARAVILPAAAEGTTGRLQLSPVVESGFEEGLYVPRPYLEEGWLCDVSESLIESLVSGLTEAVSDH